MNLRMIVFAALASLFLCGAQENRKQHRYEVTVLEFKATRKLERVWLDGKVKNTGEHTLNGGEIVLFFLAPGGEVAAKRRFELDDKSLDPGDECEFMLETPFPARAVSIRVEAEGKDRVVISTRNGGPFVID